MARGTLGNFYVRRWSYIPSRKNDTHFPRKRRSRDFHVGGTSESTDFLFSFRECNQFRTHRFGFFSGNGIRTCASETVGVLLSLEALRLPRNPG